ncbi:uncharacterized protein [Antedon mediterranea]|uniref:uncharacterized protein n=1 Tax=Antedon mediterranea TaxID=105859 RepID=UPI003AF56C78
MVVLLLRLTMYALSTGLCFGDIMFVTRMAPGIFISNISMSGDATLKLTKVIDSTTSTYAVGYDSKTLTIFWSDHDLNNIQRYSFETEQHEPFQSTGDVFDLVVDEIGRKLYWVDTGVEVINLDGTNRTVLLEANPLRLVSGIALDTTIGYLYWGIENEKIERAQLNDTSNRETIVTGVQLPIGIALSPVDGKMYWCDPRAKIIEKANLDGTNRETVARITPFMYDIEIYENYLYVSTLDGMISIDIRNGQVHNIVDDFPFITGVYIGPDACNPNPCQNSGNCSLTSTSSLFTCACTSGYTGRTCKTYRPTSGFNPIIITCPCNSP